MTSFLKSIKQAISFPAQRMKSGVSETITSADQLAAGEGAVIMHNGEKVAVSKSTDGSVTMLSAKCTHAGCTVTWNAAEKAWDCPCHGSRFSAAGKVIKGPAATDLAKKAA